MSEPSIAIGIDLGGTNLKAAAVDSSGHILGQQTFPLQPQPTAAAALDKMVEMVDALLAEQSQTRNALAGVGIGSPGPLSVTAGKIVRAANLPGWEDMPIRDELQSRIGCKVVFDNDGNAAAFGEAWVGAGKDGADLVMLTLGTGVGAGIVMDGRIIRGHFENAGEIGHTIAVVDGLPCACGKHGCLEQYSSAAGVTRRVIAAVRCGERSGLATAVQAEEPIDAQRIAQCAQAGDELCQRVWDDACLHLAVACINLQHCFNPARIVLGGGMSMSGAFLLDRVRQHFDARKWNLHDDFPEILLAELGYDAGVIGAAGLIWKKQG